MMSDKERLHPLHVCRKFSEDCQLLLHVRI